MSKLKVTYYFLLFYGCLVVFQIHEKMHDIIESVRFFFPAEMFSYLQTQSFFFELFYWRIK